MSNAASTLTPEQEAAHYAGIGGSTAPAILGLDPYRTPLDAYNQIINPNARPDLSDNQAVMSGIYLEGGIRKFASDRLGTRIRESHQTLKHPQHDFMVAHIDGRIVGERAGFEAKNRGFFRSKEYGAQGTDQVIDSELIQCMHYLAVTGWDRWYLAVLIGGQELRLFTIERDEELIKTLIEKERDFWQGHVTKRIPPPPTTLSDIHQLYPSESGEAAALSIEAQAAVTEMKDLKDQIKNLKKKHDELEFTIKSEAAEAAILTDHTGTTLATWKNQTTNRLDQKGLKSTHPELCKQFTNQSTSRVLRLK